MLGHATVLSRAAGKVFVAVSAEDASLQSSSVEDSRVYDRRRPQTRRRSITPLHACIFCPLYVLTVEREPVTAIVISGFPGH